MKKQLLFFLSIMLFSTANFAQNTVGVLQYDATQTADGYNLYYPHFQTYTYLLDNCGRVVNTWGDAIYEAGNSVYLQNDGSIIRCGTTGSTANPWIHRGGAGQVVQRFDWHNNLLWQYEVNDSTQRMHHDIEVLPNGNILMIVWERLTEAEAIAEGRNPNNLANNELFPDKIIEVEPIGTNGGNIVWEWHAMDHLIQNFDSTKANFGIIENHHELIDINYDTENGNADWLHTNSIDYHPILDQILLSVPTFDEVWIIDHSTTTVEAATHSGGNSGKGGDLIYRWGNPKTYQPDSTFVNQFAYQHDAHWILDVPISDPDYGKIMVFNNRIGNNFSAVSIINPVLNTVTNHYEMAANSTFLPITYDWHYTASTPQTMFSAILSSAQRLPNGNTLICMGHFGHSIEINPSGQTVWEFINPMQNGTILSQGTTPVPTSNIQFQMKRYPSDFPAFMGKDLTPTNFLELNPDSTICLNAVNTQNVVFPIGSNIYPNPTHDILNIEFGQFVKGNLQLYNILGECILEQPINTTDVQLRIESLENGIYFLMLDRLNLGKIIVAD